MATISAAGQPLADHPPARADFAKLIRDAGGSVDFVNLPEQGIKGNSHMIMMDRNSDEVAGLIQNWLAEKKLYR